jgi:hypothetical protein
MYAVASLMRTVCFYRVIPQTGVKVLRSKTAAALWSRENK